MGEVNISKDPFCDANNILEQAYYKTKFTYALYNVYPVVRGHTLIIPRRHASDIVELTDDEANDMMSTIRRIVPTLLRVYRADSSYNIVSQIGPYSGRTVDHLHIHIIPRNKFDMYSDYNDRLYKDLRKYELKNIATHAIEPEVRRLRKIFDYK